MKKLIPLIAAAAVAVASYFAYGLPLGDALAIATDNSKAKAACEKLLTEQPEAPAAK